MENKIIKKLLIAIVSIFAIIFILKQIFGFSPIGYIYNAYYNSFNNYKIIESTYSVKLPFFNWRINKKDSSKTVVYGMKTNNDFLKATFDNTFLFKSINEINTLCSDKNYIEKEINIDEDIAIDIYCENQSIKELKPYRMVLIPNKVLIFMYDYQEEHSDEYEKLISTISILK